MTENPDIKNILLKFVKNECNPEEIEQVVAYYQMNKLTDDFPTLEDIEPLLENLPEMKKETADQLFANILSKTQEKEVILLPKRNKSWLKYTAIAASLLLLLIEHLPLRFLPLNQKSRLDLGS